MVCEQSDWNDWTDSQDENELDELKDTRLEDLKGLGSKTADRLRDSGIDTIQKLEEACKSREVRNLKGFGKRTERKLLNEIDLARKGIYERKPYEKAEEIWQKVETHLSEIDEKFDRVQPAGSYRRGRDTVGDLDVLIESEESQPIYSHFEDWEEVDQVLALGEDKMSFRIGMMQVDLEVVPTKSYGAALLYFTGSAGHNMVMRGIAKSKGYRLDEWGLWKYEDGMRQERIAGETEEEIYEALDMDYLEPSERSEENAQRAKN